jgi:hypothetical protein
MPLYSFQNVKTGEVKDFFFSMNSVPCIGEIKEIEEQKWKRLVPERVHGIVKGSDNPMSPQQFVEKTKNQKGSIGDLLDQSQELSEKRKKTYDGVDPIQNKYFDKWTERRGGKKRHPSDDRPLPKSKLKIKK